MSEHSGDGGSVGAGKWGQVGRIVGFNLALFWCADCCC